MTETFGEQGGWIELRKERPAREEPPAVASPPAAYGAGPAPAAAPAYEPGRLYRLPPESLRPDPEQPRRWFDPQALAELAASVRAHGVLQPVLFRLDAAGQPVLVAGERRTQAARAAGLAEIPALCTAGDAAEISLVENLLRENLTPLEEAEALQRLTASHGYTQERLAAVIGKAQSTLSEILSLNRLPEEVKARCRNDPAIPRRALVEVARKRQARSMAKAFRKLVEKRERPPDPRKGKPRPRRDAVERLVAPLRAALDKLAAQAAALGPAERERLWTAWEEARRDLEQAFSAFPPPE